MTAKTRLLFIVLWGLLFAPLPLRAQCLNEGAAPSTRARDEVASYDYAAARDKSRQRGPTLAAAADDNRRLDAGEPANAAAPGPLERSRDVPTDVEAGHIKGVVTLSLQRQVESSYCWWPFDWWSDVGAPVPSGHPNPKNAQEAKGKTVLTNCLLGAHLPVVKAATPPGPLGEIAWLFKWMPDAPGVRMLMQAPRYAEVNEENCPSLVKWLQMGKDQLQGMGRVNEADTQQKSIDCLKSMCKSLGWPSN